MPESPPNGIKTNIIAGFLGSGKSTNILNLFDQRPESERWAVLVNEFGEIGIDGALLSQPENSDIFVREVPGGCMCCASGIPLHMALNMLLARAKPDRLIIEPSGLGHPKELAEALNDSHYKSLLSLGATVTLIDARRVSSPGYTEHPLFKEQVEVADLIFASKSDLYKGEEIEQLKKYLDSLGLLKPPRILETTSNRLSLKWLEENSLYKPSASSLAVSAGPVRLNPVAETLKDFNTFPPEGFLRFENLGKEFESYGWVFNSSFVFDDRLVARLFKSANAERIKAVLRTGSGSLAFNFSGDEVDSIELKEIKDSRIEVIAKSGFSNRTFEKSLLQAVAV